MADFPRRLETARLVLRLWQDADLAPFAAMNADPAVMEYFPSTQSRADSDASAARIRAHWGEDGFGLWAVELPGEAEFAGFVGVCTPRFDAPFTPCVEIGWRLGRAFWGRGYATEGARAALTAAFDALGLHEIVAMTVPRNERSRRVMEKLGMMRRAEDDFDHPLVPAGSPQRRHVLYRIDRVST